MDPATYTKKLRRYAAVSWLTPLLVMLILVRADIIPYCDYLPFVALAAGAVPIWIYAHKHRAACPMCGGGMKIVAGFPRIIYRCMKCGRDANTGIHPDY